ncbi:MAG: hypothetical protein Q9183_004831 [Haloplaca sp. 2 TL-2023]
MHQTTMLSDLRRNPDLWYRIRVLLHDLSNVGNDASSEKRLSATTNELYISGPYFTEAEATQILSTLVDLNTLSDEGSLTSSPEICTASIQDTIHQRLANFFDKRKASGDSRPCGPHDMLPIYLDVFEVQKQDLKDEKFLGRLRRSGLGDSAKGSDVRDGPVQVGKQDKKGKKRSIEDGTLGTFSREYSTCWIDSQLQDGKQLTDIEIQSLDNGALMTPKLARDVWERSLICGPWRADFAPLCQKHALALHDRESALATLVRTIPKFTQSCQNFVYDLQNLTADKRWRGRLDETGHEFSLGPPYFNRETDERIFGLRTSRRTVEKVLRDLATQRVGAKICASHDLAPNFESVLGVVWDKEKRKSASTQHRMQGAELSSEGRLKRLKNKGSKMFSDVFQTERKDGGSGGDRRREGKGGSRTGTGSSIA